MSQDSKIEQVKLKKRVADHGEVFTAERELNILHFVQDGPRGGEQVESFFDQQNAA